MNLNLKNFIKFYVLQIVFLSVAAFAQNHAADDNVMKETQDLLKNKPQRDELIKKDSKAREADNKVNAVTGGDAAQSQKLYEISADIMPSLMQAVGNDPVKATELLQKAQTDPEAFYNSLPAEVRQKIRGVASEIEAKGKSKKNP